jgi:hypothetical protein
VREISQIIYNIKNLAYRLVNININIEVPLKKYENNNNKKILHGLKIDVNDLKKIESILRAYINSNRNKL